MLLLLQNEKIVFGQGAFEQLAGEAARLGRRALLVTGRAAMRRAGVIERAERKLERARCHVTLFDHVEQDPSLETVEAGMALARSARCDLVVAIGGGSALDAAKAIALLAPHHQPLRHCFDRQADVTGPGLALIAIPTTAGSGAEATVNAVLTDKESRLKKSLRSNFMLPRVALADPLLTLSLTRETTANTGMDALTQAIECFLSRSAQAYSDALSLEAAGLLYAALPQVVAQGGNVDAREQMMLGSLMAGMAFSNAALGAAHGLSHPLGAQLDLPHGFLCGVLLPEVLELNRQAPFRDWRGRSTEEKMALLAARLGLSSADELVVAVRRRRAEVGLPSDLAGHGLRSELFPALLAGCRSRSMSNNPRELSDDDVLGLLGKLARSDRGAART